VAELPPLIYGITRHNPPHQVIPRYGNSPGTIVRNKAATPQLRYHCTFVQAGIRPGILNVCNKCAVLISSESRAGPQLRIASRERSNLHSGRQPASSSLLLATRFQSLVISANEDELHYPEPRRHHSSLKFFHGMIFNIQRRGRSKKTFRSLSPLILLYLTLPRFTRSKCSIRSTRPCRGV